MSKSENKNDNKSMFLYTALIFIVAVLLIILSFFGQTNMQKSQPKIAENAEETQSLSGISEKAAVLSEENVKLLEENNKLKSENTELSNSNNTLSANNSLLTKYKENNDLLLSANGYFNVENYSMSREMLDKVNYNELTDDQKILYNTIQNNLE